MRNNDGWVTSPLKVAGTDLSRNGTVRRKPVKADLWAKHAVDQDAGRVGRRYATRHAGSTAQYGMANALDHMDTEDFLHGDETYPEYEKGDAVLRSALNDEVLGWLPLQEAMAYKIAAARRGVVVEVMYEV